MRSLLTPLWAAGAFRDGSPPPSSSISRVSKDGTSWVFCSVEGMTEIAAGCNGPETYY